VDVFWMQLTSATTHVVKGARVKSDQTVSWNEFLASDGTKGKSRLDSALSTCGFAMVAYGNGPSGSVDIQVQNVLPKGDLGNPAMPGDMNCDGVVDLLDIPGFVAALLDPAGYAQQYPCCNVANANVNQDAAVDGLDIQPFVNLLLGI
jgi:hypothetical protein